MGGRGEEILKTNRKLFFFSFRIEINDNLFYSLVEAGCKIAVAKVIEGSTILFLVH